MSRIGDGSPIPHLTHFETSDIEAGMRKDQARRCTVTL